MLTPKSALFVLARHFMEWRLPCLLLLAALADFLFLLSLLR